MSCLFWISWRWWETRVAHGSDEPAGRVGSDRVGSGHDFAGFWRVGSALRIFQFFLHIISWYLNGYESSNATFGLIDFLRYLIYIIINLLINNYSIRDNSLHMRGGEGRKSSQTFCRQSRVGSTFLPGRIGSDPRQMTRGKLCDRRLRSCLWSKSKDNSRLVIIWLFQTG